MKNGARSRTARVLGALAVTAAMGFGGAQAFASPAAAAADESRACSSGQCTQECRKIGYNVGVCESGTCVCYFTS
jgi:hypothetical protein